MKDQYKKKKLLIEELEASRRQVVKLRKEEAKRKRAEEALRESEEKFATAFRNSPDSITLIGLSDERVVEVNDGFCHATGYRRDEILGHTSLELNLWSDPGERARFVSMLRDQKRVISFEASFRIKSGEIRVGLAAGEVVHIGGEPFALITIRDITERKKVENALKESEERYRRLVENSPAVVWSFSDKRGTLFVSSRVKSILGYSPDFLYENPFLWNQSIHPDDKYIVTQAIKDFASGKDLKVEYRIKDSSENWRWFYDRSIGRRVGDGESIIEGFSVDITERKRAEEAQRESEMRFREMFENMSSGVAIYKAINDGEDFVFTDINPAGSRIGKRSREETVGRSVREVYPSMRDLGLFDVFKRVWKSGKPERYPAARYQDERVTIWVENYVCKLPSGEIATIYEDITERKKTEEEREHYLKQTRRSREQLKSLSHRLVEVQEAERRDLVRKLHDEVGQDLTALSLNLNIVQSIVRSQLPAKMGTNLTTRMDDSLNLVEGAVERIRDLMAELRPPVLDDYGLTAALHWYGKQFSERTGTTPVLQLEELAPRLPLSTETALFRIAQEALTNVAKYAKAEHVVLALDEVDGEVQLTIADDGIGFDSWNNHQSGAKPKWGLINMCERAQAIGGHLSVESSPGKGTRIAVEVERSH